MQNPEAFREWIDEAAAHIESGRSLASLPDDHLLKELLILEKTPAFGEQLIGLQKDLEEIRMPKGVSKYKHPALGAIFYATMTSVAAATAVDALFTADGSANALMYFGNKYLSGTPVADTARSFLTWRGVPQEQVAEKMQQMGATAGVGVALGALFLLAKTRSHVLDRGISMRTRLRTLIIVAGTMGMMALGGVVSLGGAVVEGSLGGKEGQKIAAESEKLKKATAELPKQVETIVQGIDKEIDALAEEVAKSGYGPKTLYTLLVLGKLTPEAESKFEAWANTKQNPQAWKDEWIALRTKYSETLKKFGALGLQDGQGLAQAFKSLTKKITLTAAIDSLDQTKQRGLNAGAATIQDHIAGTLHLDLVGLDRAFGAHAFHDKLFLIQSELTNSLNMLIASLKTYEHLQVDDRKTLMSYLDAMFAAGKDVKSNSSTPLPNFASKLDTKIQIPNLPLTVGSISKMKGDVKNEPVGIIFQVLDTKDGREAITQVLRNSGYQLDMEKEPDRQTFLLSLMGIYGTAAFAPGIAIILTNFLRARRFDRVIRSEFDAVNDAEADIADTLALRLQGFMRMAKDYFGDADAGMQYELPLELTSVYIREKIRRQAFEELPAFLEKESLHTRFYEYWKRNYSTPVRAVESLLEFDHTPEDAEIVNAYLRWLQRKTDALERLDSDHAVLVELFTPICPAFSAAEAAFQNVVRPATQAEYGNAVAELTRNAKLLRLEQLGVLAPLVREQAGITRSLVDDLNRVPRMGDDSKDLSSPEPLRFDEQYIMDTYVRAQVLGDAERYEHALAQIREAGIDIERSIDGTFSGVFADDSRVDFRPSQAVLDMLKRHRAARTLALGSDVSKTLDTETFNTYMNHFRGMIRPAMDAFKRSTADVSIFRERPIRIRSWHDEGHGQPTIRVEVLETTSGTTDIIASVPFVRHPIPDLRSLDRGSDPVAAGTESAREIIDWLTPGGSASSALEMQLLHADMAASLAGAVNSLDAFRAAGASHIFPVFKEEVPSEKMLLALATVKTLADMEATLDHLAEAARAGVLITPEDMQLARKFRIDSRNPYALTEVLSVTEKQWRMFQDIKLKPGLQIMYDARERGGCFVLRDSQDTVLTRFVGEKSRADIMNDLQSFTA